MGFLARLYADGRGSANADAPALRMAEEAGGAETAGARTQPAWELSRTLPEAGPALRESDPFAAASDAAPAAVERAITEGATKPAARSAADASIGASIGSGETGQARYYSALSDSGPDGKSGMRSMPATRSDASGAEPASGGRVQGPRVVDSMVEPASPGPVAETLRGRGAAGDDGAKVGGKSGGPSGDKSDDKSGEKSGDKVGEKKPGKGVAENRHTDPFRPEARDTMNPGAVSASRPGAGAPSGSPDREAGTVSTGPAVPASKKSVPEASSSASGGNSLDTALGAMARTQKDRTRSFGAYDSQRNLEGTRNPERTSRPEPAQGPRVVIGSLEIRVEAPAPSPAAPQESAAAARSRSYRVEW